MENKSTACDDPEMKEKPVWETNKHRINSDYLLKPLPAITLDAVYNAESPNHHNARVLLKNDETMGASVLVAGSPLRKNDYISFCSVKEALTGDKYRERYPIGATTLTDAQLRDKDYIIKWDLYKIGNHTNPENPSGIAQYLNIAMRSSGSRNNCKLVRVTINK